MNAYLMAAGIATRLRPITEHYPKCLLPVRGGSPILEHWICACLSAKTFDNIFINVHHCASTVEDWLTEFRARAARLYGKKAAYSVRTIDETAGLLGTAGTLFWHADTTEDFFLAYADTYSATVFHSLKKMAKDWSDNPDNPLAGLITFNLPTDGSAGAIESDFMGTVKSFHEKGREGLVGWAGMMFARKDFTSNILKTDKDLARDVFPRLCGRIRVLAHVEAYDIGRGVEKYEHIKSS